MKRRIIALALIMSFAMAGCGNKASEESVNLDRKEATVKTDSEVVEQTSDNQIVEQQEVGSAEVNDLATEEEGYDLSEVYDLNVKAAFEFEAEYEPAFGFDFIIPAYSFAELSSARDGHIAYACFEFNKDAYELVVEELTPKEFTAADVISERYKTYFAADVSPVVVGNENSSCIVVYNDAMDSNSNHKANYAIWDVDSGTVLSVRLTLSYASATSKSGQQYIENLTSTIVSYAN